jgi:predicted nucleotidyltransferase
MTLVHRLTIHNNIRIPMSEVGRICTGVGLDAQLVANAYIFGSVKLGLQSEGSDVDLILVTHAPIAKEETKATTRERARSVAHSKIGEIQFYETSQNYFHVLDLRTCLIDEIKYDVVVYDQFQFRTILQSHFMTNVECLFSRNEFILKQDIDFLPFYLESCHNKV